MCRTRTAAHVMGVDSEDSEYSEDDVQFHSMPSSENNTDFYENIEINGNKKIYFQLDTGSPINILPYKELKSLGLKKEQLNKTKKILSSYTKDKLKPLGTVRLTAKYKKRQAMMTFYVVDLQQIPLLSHKACVELNLIKRIHKTTIEEFCPEIKNTTGIMSITVQLDIDETAEPVVHGPRPQPKALLPAIKEKLLEMESEGFIEKVTEPTDWVSSMAVSQRNGKIRICLDPSNVNKAIKRSIYPMKTVEQVMSQLSGAKYFSTLDAKSGYCQLPLDEKSSYLTVFNTPLGRFRWLRLPFGIKSAPEIYQRTMDTMLEGIDGATAIMDDIIIASSTLEEHDKIIETVLQRATNWNVKLNMEECKLRQTSIKYVGHIITDKGVKPDHEKVRAVMEMPEPKSKEDIGRFLGFITYLGKFIPKLSEVDNPLRDVNKCEEFFWNKPQAQAFKKLKELCAKETILAYYDVTKETTIQCDASSYGLGAALVQGTKVIAYASRALNKVEQNYSQIQKELKAIEFACEKFHTYIYAKPVKVESDHKPLEIIFKKPMHLAPRRLQTMLLRLSIYDIEVIYKKGSTMYLADTLSRAKLPETTVIKEEETIMVHKVSVSDERIQHFRQNTTRELSELVTTILEGWPEEKSLLPEQVKPYWNFREELDYIDGVIYKRQRIIIPPAMRTYALQCIHASHMGIEKCKARSRESCYWPGINQDIEQMIESCLECQEHQRKQQAQPMIQRRIPDRPWEHCASDLFEYKNKHYAVVVDYFSKWIATERLETETTASVIAALISVYTVHGFPDKLTTDNGPQFTSEEFKHFCTEKNINHVTSSPHYPQSNGEAERAVGTVKSLWRKS